MNDDQLKKFMLGFYPEETKEDLDRFKSINTIKGKIESLYSELASLKNECNHPRSMIKIERKRFRDRDLDWYDGGGRSPIAAYAKASWTVSSSVKTTR